MFYKLLNMRWLVPALVLLWPAAAAAQFDHRHLEWDALLKQHVVLIDGGKASRVRYAAFAQNRAALKRYLDTLSKVPAVEFNAWTRSQQVAFLINAYNAFMIEKVLTRYPDIGSVWDFGKLFGNPFRDEFFTLLGRDASLDWIEHETLRKPGVYNEPRVHYAVNCAAIGCPMLREEAYVADRLERQLEEQAMRFLSDASRNRMNPATGQLEVSRIYDWYERDWTSGYRGLRGTDDALHSPRQYFALYAKRLAGDPAQQRLISEQKVKIRFLDYDWTLNDARN